MVFILVVVCSVDAVDAVTVAVAFARKIWLKRKQPEYQVQTNANDDNPKVEESCRPYLMIWPFAAFCPLIYKIYQCKNNE